MCSLEKNGKMINLFGLSKNKIKWFGGKIKEKKFYREVAKSEDLNDGSINVILIQFQEGNNADLFGDQQYQEAVVTPIAEDAKGWKSVL